MIHTGKHRLYTPVSGNKGTGRAGSGRCRRGSPAGSGAAAGHCLFNRKNGK